MIRHDPKFIRDFTAANQFLNNHPAVNRIPYSVFTSNFTWFFFEACIHNVLKDPFEKPENVKVQIYKNSEWLRMYERNFGKDKRFENPNYCAMAKYYDLFGYNWEPDHLQFHMQCHMFQYIKGSLEKRLAKEEKNIESIDTNLWLDSPGFHDILFFDEIRMSSLEECIIEAAKKVKKHLGDYSFDDFLSEEEKENHRTNGPFLSVKKEKSPGFVFFRHNPKYIRVTSGEINLRWWNWYRTTKHCKKHWDGR